MTTANQRLLLGLDYATTGFGGHEIAANAWLKMAAGSCRLVGSLESCDPRVREDMEGLVDRPEETTKVRDTVIIAPSFVNGCHRAMRRRLRGRVLIYAPFWGYEYIGGRAAKVARKRIADLYLCLPGFYSLQPYWHMARPFLSSKQHGIPNTSSNSKFVEVPTDRSRGEAAVRFINVGRCDFRQKQQDKLLACVAGSSSDFLQQLTLRFVGDGPDYPILARMSADRLYVSCEPWTDGRIEFDAKSVLVFSSAFEGLPLVALEALSAGLPVVATVMSGLGDLVPPAAIFDVTDPASLRRAAEAVLRDRPALIADARSKLQAMYSRTRLTAEVDRLIHRLKGGSRA